VVVNEGELSDVTVDVELPVAGALGRRQLDAMVHVLGLEVGRSLHG